MYRIFKNDCINVMKKLKTKSLKAIITDPPYNYLKKQKDNLNDWDKPFDEPAFFEEAKRILKDDGFIVMFGMGQAYFRRNVIMDEKGFIFKYEIVWNKKNASSMFHRIGKQHENICIYTKKSGCANQIKIPYIEYITGENAKKITQKISLGDFLQELKIVKSNVKKIATALNCEEKLADLKAYLKNRMDLVRKFKTYSHSVSTDNENDIFLREMTELKAIIEGKQDKDIWVIPDQLNMPNKSCKRHPTEKPVLLMERLINLTTEKEDLILDPFMGSGTTAVAALNLGRNFIGVELKDDFYEIAKNRIMATAKNLSLVASVDHIIKAINKTAFDAG